MPHRRFGKQSTQGWRVATSPTPPTYAPSDSGAYTLPSRPVLSPEQETAVLRRIERGATAVEALVGLLMPPLEGTVRKCTFASMPAENILVAAQTGLREILFGLGTNGATLVTEPKELLHHLRRKVAAIITGETHPSPCGRGDGEAWVEDLFPTDPLERQIAAVLDVEATLCFAVEDRVKAAHTVVEANMRLVRKVALSMAGRGVGEADLMQEGAIALQKAALTFRPSKGFRFLTYAVPAVQTAMLDRTRTSMGLSDHAARELTKFIMAKHELRQSLSKEPSNEEVFDFLAWSPTKRRNMENALRIVQRPKPLGPPGEDGETSTCARMGMYLRS